MYIYTHTIEDFASDFYGFAPYRASSAMTIVETIDVCINDAPLMFGVEVPVITNWTWGGRGRGSENQCCKASDAYAHCIMLQHDARHSYTLLRTATHYCTL